MGHAGLAIYILMEICAEKVEKKLDTKLEYSDFIFSFHPRVIDNALRMKRKSTRNILGISQECGLLKFTHSENEVVIEMPILLDLLEYDLKKPVNRTARKPPENRLEQNRIDIEQNRVEQIKTKTLRKRSPAPPDHDQQASQLIALYCDLWKVRYKSERSPDIEGKSVGLIKKLLLDVGFPRSKEIITAYLNMPDSWFITKRHDIASLSLNLTKVSHFLNTGKTVSNQEVGEIDRGVSQKNLIDALRRGEV